MNLETEELAETKLEQAVKGAKEVCDCERNNDNCNTVSNSLLAGRPIDVLEFFAGFFEIGCDTHVI